jgi:inner membrane protein involved in colicin E2 resistance
VLYFILQMEDYALLAGAGTMMLIIMVLMFATRNLEHDS